MTNRTFASLSEFAGSRLSSNQDIEQACDKLDSLPFSDLLTLLTMLSHTRVETVTPHSVLSSNRFHTPSRISQRDLHWVDGVVMEIANEIEFIELSPLQPFGINHALAGTNQKNIVSALRRSEINADATTALFRIALDKFNKNSDDFDSVRVGSNTRTVRAQTFSEDTGFLPHFKVFGEVTVGRQSSEYGMREIEGLVSHLGTEVDILDKISQSERSNVQDLYVSIGNLSLLESLSSQGRIDITEARKNTINPDYSLIEANQLDIPEYIDLDDPNLINTLADLGFKTGVKSTEKIRVSLERLRPDILPITKLHLGRIAGIGYYKHVCYKLAASNNHGVSIPVSDGGTTDWATKSTQNKNLYTVSSGIGTELVCQYLIN